MACLPESPRWLAQCHSIDVIDSDDWSFNLTADGLYSSQSDRVCAVLTADCLPVLICNKAGTQVAAVHAGWRGLAEGILEQAISLFSGNRNDILIWLGPAIGSRHFEVGHDVVTAFTEHASEAELAFRQTDSSHFMADIYLLARQRLSAMGITEIYGGNLCTVSDPDHFFSYRRDNVSGRLASLIWISSR
ncbi:UNVERIFIED_CONTAM: hypothetical protein GTU68_031452 [Idotea baltica]|nr:hypothetical protein [Idotea baltica]